MCIIVHYNLPLVYQFTGYIIVALINLLGINHSCFDNGMRNLKQTQSCHTVDVCIFVLEIWLYYIQFKLIAFCFSSCYVLDLEKLIKAMHFLVMLYINVI